MSSIPDLRTNVDLFEHEPQGEPIQIEVALHETFNGPFSSHLTLTVGKVDLSIFTATGRNLGTLKALWDDLGAILQAFEHDNVVPITKGSPSESDASADYARLPVTDLGVTTHFLSSLGSSDGRITLVR